MSHTERHHEARLGAMTVVPARAFREHGGLPALPDSLAERFALTITPAPDTSFIIKESVPAERMLRAKPDSTWN